MYIRGCASGGVYVPSEDVPLVGFMYRVLTHMPGESYRRRLRSLLLCLCDVFRAFITSFCLLILHKQYGVSFRLLLSTLVVK